MWFVKDNQANPYHGHSKLFPVVLKKRIFIVQVFINFWTVTHRNWKQSWHLVQLQVFITPIRILWRICLHFGRLLADTFLVRRVQSLADFLVLVLCNVHISSHPLNKQQEQITFLKEKTLILSFEWTGPGAHCVFMEMSQWKYCETLWWVQQLYKVSVLYRKRLQR